MSVRRYPYKMNHLQTTEHLSAKIVVSPLPIGCLLVNPSLVALGHDASFAPLGTHITLQPHSGHWNNLDTGPASGSSVLIAGADPGNAPCSRNHDSRAGREKRSRRPIFTTTPGGKARAEAIA